MVEDWRLKSLPPLSRPSKTSRSYQTQIKNNKFDKHYNFLLNYPKTMHLSLLATATFLTLTLAAPSSSKAISPAFIWSSKAPDCYFGDDTEVGKGLSNLNTTCQRFTPVGNNIGIDFGRWDSKAHGITLYTDANCKNVGKAGQIKRPKEHDDVATACLHPSDFGGEVWGSVMQTS